MVEVKDLSLTYGQAKETAILALAGLNAGFETGAFSVIVGPSGCGKTSLIKIMAGLLKPSAGTVSVKGKNTALIFQDYGLLPWKTVRGNAELPLRFCNTGRKERRERADALFAKFGLKGFEKAYPRELSGGMKQRLAIIRALLMEPQLLLMDEPFSSLDTFTREEAQDFFLSIKKELELTIVMVSHSIEEAVYLADTVYIMASKNPGTIKCHIHISRNGESHSDFRETPKFYEYCSSLRQLLKNPAGEAQA